MLVFNFPGQGSQRPGMGRPWREHDSWELVEEASDVAGRDLAHLLIEADAETLKDTRNAQLTTYVSSLMVLDAVQRLGIDADCCAGHSLGEYTALAAIGAISFDDGVRLVAERAAAMHDAGQAQPGTMAAVLGLDDDQVEVACGLADDDVWVANYNAPGQVVIAGSNAAVQSASDHARQLGAKKVMALPVAGAFHTPYMAAARTRLREAIAETEIRDTDIAVVSNVDALAHDRGEDWTALLSAQLTSPVRWKHCLQTLERMNDPSSGALAIAELGPGGVLSGMAKRTIEGARTISVSTPEDLDRLLEWISARASAPAPRVEGEHLFAVERLVVSPAAGVFTPAELEPETRIEVGDVIGHVGDEQVRSPFGGTLQSFIAMPTERVAPRQPIAWLRAD